MKASKSLEPKQRKAFRDKYLAAILAVAALLFSTIVSAQTDSLKYSQINGYGFKYKRMAFDSVLMIPRSSSPHAPYRAGALRYREADSTLQLWTGYQWNSILTGVGNGIDTAYMINDTVLTIETPDEDFFLQVGKRYIDTLYRKSGQDSIFYRIAGIERAIKDSTGASGINQLTGDVTAGPGSGSQVATIAANAVTNSKFRQSAGLSVVGTAGNSTANVDDITAGTDNQVLRRFGTSLGFGAINLASSNAVTGLLPVANGGTGTSSPALVAGTNISITGTWPNQTINASGSGPGGSTTQIQYNNSGAFAGDAGLTYDVTNNRITTDSIEAKTIRQDSGFYRRLAPFIKSDTAYLIGNSHTVGTGATVTDSAYAYREAAALGVAPVSVAVSGTGAVSIANRFLINKNPGNTTMAIVMDGFNDPRRNASLPRKTLNKIINSHKAIFANQYLKSYTNAGTGGTGVTRSGSWANSWNAQNEGGKTTVGAYTSATNDSISYTFTDSTVIVGLMGGDGSGSSYTGTDIDVRIDGGAILTTINTNNQTDGVSDGSGLDNKRCAMAFIFTGLTNASHTITLIKKSTGGGGYMIFDYFGHLVDRSVAQLMLWHHIPKMDATGYATSPSGSTDATTDTVNAKIDSLKTAYPISLYPTYVVPTNTVYNVATDIYTDHIHMANSGHRKIADLAINTTLQTVMPAPGQAGAMYFTNEFRGVTESGNKAFVMREDGDSRYIMNTNVINQSANFNITGTGTAAKFVTAATALGTGLSANENIFVAGRSAVGNNSFFSLKLPSAAAGNRIFQVVKGDGTIGFQFADSIGGAADILTVFGSSSGVTSIRIPKLTINQTAGNALVIDGYVTGTGIEIGANGAVAGMFTGMKTNQSYSSGFFVDLKNTSSNSAAETNIKLTTAGSGSGSPSLSFVNTASGLNYSAGNDVATGNFTITNGTIAAGTKILSITSAGSVGIGATSPTARLHIPAGTASANTAPLKLTSGTNLTTPEDGAVEYDGAEYYGTVGSTRYQFSRVLKGSTTWQPGIVAAGSSTTTTITVTGASLGDPVTISKASGAYSNGEVYDAFVSATNTVTVRVHNVSTGSANYNTTETYNVVVLKY